MTTRLIAAGILVVSALVAWVTITVPVAARLLQVAIAASMLYVAWLAWRGARAMRAALVAADRGVPAEEPHAGSRRISLVMPARNEAAVIGASVASVRGLVDRDWDLLVVDDASDDGTGDRARAAAEADPRVRVLRREPGEGPRTKGAALAFAMPHVRGAVVGALDADTRVDPDFLAAVRRAWARDPDAVALQVARRPRHAERSWLLAAQAEEQLMDLASQCGRRAVDGTAELRGNGMFVRRDVLDAVGGWSPVALTEDLELSTRLSAAGHHVALAPEVGVDEEAVEMLGALWHQRLRWAEGSLRRLMEHGPGFLAGGQPLGRKLDFLAFSGEFMLPPLFVTTILASVVTIPLPRPADWTVPVSLFLGYGLGVFLLALGGLWAVGEHGPALAGRSLRGALFLSHWLVVVPAALARIAFGLRPTGFVQTRRFGPPDR
jgi:1,2-diacylglycerol 3-beta-glucosyltransferase